VATSSGVEILVFYEHIENLFFFDQNFNFGQNFHFLFDQSFNVRPEFQFRPTFLIKISISKYIFLQFEL